MNETFEEKVQRIEALPLVESITRPETIQTESVIAGRKRVVEWKPGIYNFHQGAGVVHVVQYDWYGQFVQVDEEQYFVPQ